MATPMTSRFDQQEGSVAKAIEKQTSKVPSDWFLWAAVGSMLASATLLASRRKQESIFIGQWVPTMLLFGVYNKLVKQLGSDRTENAA
jgi:hypothetical protein